MYNKTEIVENLKDLIFQNLNIPKEYIQNDTNLFTDKNISFDSVDAVELITDIEMYYGINLYNMDWKNYPTVDLIADEVLKRLEKK